MGCFVTVPALFCKIYMHVYGPCIFILICGLAHLPQNLPQLYRVICIYTWFQTWIGVMFFNIGTYCYRSYVIQHRNILLSLIMKVREWNFYWKSLHTNMIEMMISTLKEKLIHNLDVHSYTHRNFSEILLNQPELRLYLPFSDFMLI